MILGTLPRVLSPEEKVDLPLAVFAMEKSVYTAPSDLKLAMCNFIKNIDRLKQFAVENEFAGIDWSFNVEELPHTATGKISKKDLRQQFADYRAES